jgi:ParB-like chromosome segregation protein Spo0J
MSRKTPLPASGKSNPIQWVPLSEVIAWDRNPKPHDTANIAEIARSLVRFGFAAPLVVWHSTGRVVAGNGRLQAAALLLREDAGRLLATDAPGPGLVPVRFVEFASEAEATAYGLVDNRLTEVNPMEEQAVAALLRELEAEGADIALPGWSESALEALLNPVGVEDVAWKQFDETIGEDAPQGKQMKCPHCGEVFSA